MSDYLLYYTPGSCARVTSIALEQCEVSHEIALVRLGKGEHKTAEFLKINPKAKVPVLSLGSEVLTENPAILLYLHQQHPKAGLLPEATTVLDQYRQCADLCYCSATLHPVLTRICFPMFFAEGEAARASVRAMAIDVMRSQFALIEERLKRGKWWYENEWSIMDAYLFWIWALAHGAGFPTQEFPVFADHANRSEQHPAVKRALQREKAAIEQLRDEGSPVVVAYPLK